MGTGVTLLLWPPGNLVPGVSSDGGGMRATHHIVQVIPEHIDLAILRSGDFGICNFQIVKSPIREISKLVEYSPPTRLRRYGGSTVAREASVGGCND